MSGYDITVGAGKTLDVSGGTLTLANDLISGDAIDGGTISDFSSTGIDDNGYNCNCNDSQIQRQHLV